MSMTRCWIWPKTINGSGYGVKHVGNKMEYVHRMMFKLFRDPSLPGRDSGKCLDHICRTRSCVNPFHLELVTLGENCLRGNGASAMNARKKHCSRGHKFEMRQWPTRPRRRYCYECSKINKAKRLYDNEK